MGGKDEWDGRGCGGADLRRGDAAGVLIANSRSQAVTETKLDELTREVREHNNFARRMPVVEEQIKDLNRRLSALERK